MAHFGISNTAVPAPARPLGVVGGAAVAAIGLGAAIALAPLGTLGIFVAGALGAGVLYALRAFAGWQKFAVIGVGGLIILNYGFANLALPGLPLSVGHIALLAATFLVVQNRKPLVSVFLHEPVVMWWLCLVGLSVLHLTTDLPRYGVLAIRDASFVLEGLFMLPGFLWAMTRSGLPRPWTALAVLFLVNTGYALTFPIQGVLQSVSPVSGLFQPVPLLGMYSHTALFLVVGALYYSLVVPHMTRWPRNFVAGLAVLQIGWSFVFQDRSMYVGTVLAMLLLTLGGVRRAGRIAAVVTASVLIFFVIVGISGTALRGRVGDVGSNFLEQHLRSLFFEPNTPGEGTLEWRLTLWSELLDRVAASPDLAVFGDGFGEPLIEFKNSAGVVVRQPHNSHISVLLRLGAFGTLAWFGMHVGILLAVLRFLRDSRRIPRRHDVALWMLSFFILAMIFTSFQPWFEFSYGAIPYYFLMGLALGLSRTRGESIPDEASLVAG